MKKRRRRFFFMLAISVRGGMPRRQVRVSPSKERNSEGDSQGLPGFIHPRVLGIPTISFQQKLYSQKKQGREEEVRDNMVVERNKSI